MQVHSANKYGNWGPGAGGQIIGPGIGGQINLIAVLFKTFERLKEIKITARNKLFECFQWKLSFKMFCYDSSIL